MSTQSETKPMSDADRVARARQVTEYNLPGHAIIRNLADALAAAEASIDAVMRLHFPADNDPGRTPICESCTGKAGIHACGCWSPDDRVPVCGHCSGHSRSVIWPCPTVQALGVEG